MRAGIRKEKFMIAEIITNGDYFLVKTKRFLFWNIEGEIWGGIINPDKIFKSKVEAEEYIRKTYGTSCHIVKVWRPA